MLTAVLTSLGTVLGGGTLDEAGSTRVPEGFAIERASVAEGSFLALCFDGDGRAIVGVEDGPIRRLADADGDGLFEREEVFQPDLTGCQGLAWSAAATYAVARRGDRAGVWRIGRDGAATLLVPLTSRSEHGAHGLAFGPDGALFLACGNEGSIDSGATGGMSLERVLDGGLLTTLADPMGVGAETRIPYGFVARIDPSSGAWGYHSIGYRNHYDLAFDREGELFTVDSDMEYDEGLPWYRPVRALHARFGLDFGFRRGSSVWPDARIGCAGSMGEAGRGSPTGVTFGAGARFPPRWRDALYCGDWSRGRIVAFALEPRGGTYSARAEDFADGPACASVTALRVGPDGALYFLRGGRGLRGPMQRIAWRGTPVPTESGLHDVDVLANVEPAGDPSPDELARGDATSATARRVRRLCERLARRSVVDQRYELPLARLTSETDPALVLAARAAIARLAPDALRATANAAWNVKAPEAIATGALLRAMAGVDPWTRADIERALQSARQSARFPATALRALSIAAQRGLVARDDLRDGLDTSAERAARAPSVAAWSDPSAAWEWDELDAHAGGARAIERFLERTRSAAPRADAIRAAWLACAAPGWTASALAQFLAWYETTRAWSGGASFRGYLEALRERAASDEAVVAELARDDGACAALPPPALAFLLRRTAAIDDARRATLGVRVEDLARRFAELTERHAREPRGDARRAALSEIAGSRDEPALAWLRERARVSAEERGLALIALARAGRAEDAALLVGGLDASEFGAPKACADALMALSEPPSDAAIWSRVLDRARAQGHPRGWLALRVLARWLETPAPEARPERFDEDWRRIQAAVRRRFPALSEAAAPGPRRAYDPERLRRFLNATRARPASADAGSRVFVRATCASCHTIGGRALVAEISKGASGPDLGGVTKRLRGDELFDAVARPSLSISDQFRSIVVETRDERRFEGRVHRDDARGVELVESDGRMVEIAAEDVLARRASTVSAMPEGLLAALTFEEVRDLFAFLAADGATDDPLPPWEPLFGPTLDGEWTGGGGHFALEDGVLVGRAPRLPGPEYLLSRRSAADFELEFDVLVTRGGNSGLQYRSAARAEPEPVGYQADIGQVYWGSLYASDGRGLIHEADARLQRAAVEPDGWNHYFLRVTGDRHVIEVNGQVLTDVRDARHGDGRFAWQLHEGLEMEVRVDGARIRVLR